MQLAEINIARALYPLDDPRMADFVDNLERVNALAERSEGFVWRLQDETGNATGIAFDNDPRIIINMSVWASIEALQAFAYKTIHRRFVQGRKDWFEPMDAAHLALWWIAPGAVPDPAEGRLRLSHLNRYGPSPFAFTFSRRFDPAADVAPLGPISDDIGAREAFRPCG